MKDVKIYYGDTSKVNSMAHLNYSEYLQYTKKSRNCLALTRNIWTL